jgi:hypothetical protein
MYQLRVTDIHNCSGTYQTNLRVWKQPLVNITDYTVKEICEGQDLELSLNTDGVKFHWRGPGLDVRDQRLSQYVVKKMHPGLQGVYTAIAESPEGCVDSASMPITVNRLPDATFNFIKRCSEIITEDPVEFFANSQEKDDISWELNFVPVSTERKFTYTFDKAGTYRLKHTRVTDKGCEHFEERFMEVQAAHLAADGLHAQQRFPESGVPAGDDLDHFELQAHGLRPLGRQALRVARTQYRRHHQRHLGWQDQRHSATDRRVRDRGRLQHRLQRKPRNLHRPGFDRCDVDTVKAAGGIAFLLESTRCQLLAGPSNHNSSPSSLSGLG